MEFDLDLGMTLIGAAAGAVWTGFKSSEHYRRLQRQRHQRALQALEAGVERTYQAYVKAIKAGRADGRLTETEKARARSLARTRAIALAREAGVDLLRTIGEDYVDLWIGKLVRRRKA